MKPLFSVQLPTRDQWKRIFKVLTWKEKILFFSFLFLAICSFSFLCINFYRENTKVVPTSGGRLKMGVVGGPRFLNPIFATSDVDRDLVELIFSGLLKYDEKGKILPGLAKNFEAEDEKIFKFKLRTSFWSDGERLTADDVLFTVNLLQDPKVKSPFLINWTGVEVEKLSEDEISFRLKKPYPRFIESATFKILPSHIFKKIPREELPLTFYNFQPVGLGPFKVKELRQEKSGAIKSLKLVVNENYYGKKPKISEIDFEFFKKREDLISAAKRGKIEALSLISSKEFSEFEKRRFKKYSLTLPRYFAVFFNPKRSDFLKSENIRKALNYGTDKEEILNKVLLGEGKVVNSPILPSFFGFKEPKKVYKFDFERAKKLLKKEGFFEGKRVIKKGTEFKERLEKGSKDSQVRALQKCLAKYPKIYPEGFVTGYFGQRTKRAVIRFQEEYKEDILQPLGLKEGTGIVAKSTQKKLNEVCREKEVLKLEINLICPKQKFLIETANLLKEQWKRLGVELKINALEISELKDYIRERNYEALLFGEVLGLIPDLYPFWHSLQVQDPGLNLALFENKKADRFLEKARQAKAEERAENYEKFQEFLLRDSPCVFLYNPDFIYLVHKKVKGIGAEKIADPSKRFSGIENWYIKTKRIWK